VIHDLYVPEFRLKQDATPGITTRLLVTPNKVGTYQIICAELCGAGHAIMRSYVIVMPQGEFDSWLANARRQVQQAAANPPATPVEPPASPGQPASPPPAPQPGSSGPDAQPEPNPGIEPAPTAPSP
jgi:cytochrome c oxidase subunit 2